MESMRERFRTFVCEQRGTTPQAIRRLLHRWAVRHQTGSEYCLLVLYTCVDAGVAVHWIENPRECNRAALLRLVEGGKLCRRSK